MKAANPARSNWYVLHTKPRHEKKVADRLTKAGYMIYCPLHKVIRKWSDRNKMLEEPLFKGYLFIQIEDHNREKVFTFPGTVRYLYWLGRPAIVRKEEIAAIQKWLGHYDHERIKVTNITPGTFVRITSGKFKNEEGILLDTSNSKAHVQLKEIGIRLSLDLSQNEIKALQSSS